ncbi:unnamed protein product, partial [Sphenostylis stenocarpa]
ISITTTITSCGKGSGPTKEVETGCMVKSILAHMVDMPESSQVQLVSIPKNCD